jgi:hypothetical protein
LSSIEIRNADYELKRLILCLAFTYPEDEAAPCLPVFLPLDSFTGRFAMSAVVSGSGQPSAIRRHPA